MSFSLKLTGFALDNHDLEKSKNIFASTFHVTSDEIEKIFSANKDVSIKKNMSWKDINFYQQKITEIGLESIIIKANGDPIDQKHDIANPRKQIQSVRLLDGIQWIKTGFFLFKKSPSTWILSTLALFIPAVIISIIPVLGQLTAVIYMLSVLPLLIYGAEQISKNKKFSVFDTIKAISKTTPLFVLCVFLVTSTTASSIWITYAIASNNSGMIASVVIFSIITSIQIMGYFFTAPLTIVGNERLTTALLRSFQACIKNAAPLIFFLFLATLVHITGLLLPVVGLFITIPIVTCALYAAYQDIFIVK